MRYGPLFILVLFISCGGPGIRTTVADSAPLHSADTPVFSEPDTERVVTTPSYDRDAAIELEPHPIHLQKGVDLNLNVPKGYGIDVAFEGLRRLRFLTKSPDGRLFATDMFNTSDNKRGRVYIFGDWDSTDRVFRRVVTYKDSLHNPNQVAFYNDEGQDYIYISETGVLTRWRYHAGDTTVSGKPDTVATFPDYGLSYKYGGWHLTRSLAFHNDKLYVSVGSSCNACIEQENVRASIVEMNPDGSGKQPLYATGLRNSVGMKWIDDKLWVTSMGRDLLGPDKPEDLFQQVEMGGFYGWPYYFQYKDSVYADTAMQRMAREQQVKVPAKPPLAFCGFRAHSAPLGFAWFRGFGDSLLNDHALVCLHGSTTVARQRGMRSYG
ncbi:PQQ-dependent sugar dehydrogenase [Puia sp. P3]|uniref:PQQ-dependent sugar dehydrogenase n=1 Tax=Puia sp. P3 TaxID=3423952 RepID=UPI003D66EEAF